MDTYYLGCYWKDRKEDADACMSRILDCLKGLASCDSAFSDVYIVPKSRKLPYRIRVDFETIKPFVEKGRNREDVPPRKIIDKLGDSVSFVSGADYRDRDEQWTSGTMCGAYPQTPALVNYFALSLPKKGEVLKTLLQPMKATWLLRAMIDAWDPDWAIVQGYKFHDCVREIAGIPQYSPQRAFLGWMAYFAARVGKVPEDLPVHSRVDFGQGTLIVLTEEPVTPERPHSRCTGGSAESSASRPHSRLANGAGAGFNQ